MNTLNEFEEKLEKICYDVKDIPLSDDFVKSILEEDDQYKIPVFEITSYDLKQRNKKEQPTSNDRPHTKLWYDFWEGKNKKRFFPHSS